MLITLQGWTSFTRWSGAIDILRKRDESLISHEPPSKRGLNLKRDGVAERKSLFSLLLILGSKTGQNVKRTSSPTSPGEPVFTNKVLANVTLPLFTINSVIHPRHRPKQSSRYTSFYKKNKDDRKKEPVKTPVRRLQNRPLSTITNNLLMKNIDHNEEPTSKLLPLSIPSSSPSSTPASQELLRPSIK
ncbi:unnamed protein product [Didymodactylos carnosus]|uniref:Uncharacterized protein n=1 Tax=Didymodactylos carnosus TaxID=1234261 RepID=A0A813V614_9BILA|nr:unnamed protein product [Didymodactylos carnosus]CAF0840426.1 unnamed protein product [Didymodactylos carnosus]CAF3590728.1 unnamed protein product [Didymodactylos carnosus]CAF3627767.1 unnamed protein product [Didymodactylos carnosus]